MIADYEDWISNRAEELSQERYNKDYYDLPENIQMEVWQHAIAEWTDRESARIDAAHDAAQEAQMIAESEAEDEAREFAEWVQQQEEDAMNKPYLPGCEG